MILWLLVRYWNFCFKTYIWHIPLLYGILALCTVPPLLHAVMSTAITLWGRWRKRRWQKRRDIWLLQENLPATYTVIDMTANCKLVKKQNELNDNKKNVKLYYVLSKWSTYSFFLKKDMWCQMLDGYKDFCSHFLFQHNLQKCMFAKNFVQLHSVHMLNWP